MTGRIEYRFKEDAGRGTPLEIIGPKRLIDEATFSPQGPLRGDAGAAPGQSVLGRHYDGQGNITLDFVLESNGIPYFHGPAHIRSRKTLEIIARLDAFAHQHDAADSRITISLSPAKRTYGALAEDHFGVSFERPQSEVSELAARIQSGMIRAAKPLYLYETKNHSATIHCTVVDESELHLTMGPKHEDERLIMATDSVTSSVGEHIDLVDTQSRTPEERLAALLGVIYALPDARV
jgi:hypothetical protein